jgi:hypothetical protein
MEAGFMLRRKTICTWQFAGGPGFSRGSRHHIAKRSSQRFGGMIAVAIHARNGKIFQRRFSKVESFISSLPLHYPSPDCPTDSFIGARAPVDYAGTIISCSIAFVYALFRHRASNTGVK